MGRHSPRFVIDWFGIDFSGRGLAASLRSTIRAFDGRRGSLRWVLWLAGTLIRLAFKIAFIVLVLILVLIVLLVGNIRQMIARMRKKPDAVLARGQIIDTTAVEKPENQPPSGQP